MKKIAIGLMAFGLVGCASTKDVMEREPKAIYQSSRSAGDVAFCIAQKHEVPVYDREDGVKVVLLKTWVGATHAAIAVHPHEDGSLVEYNHGFGVKPAFMRKCIEG
jgi:hypothetical protein